MSNDQGAAPTVVEPDAYGYASRLATHIWRTHYKDVSPQWKPLDDLLGVLTQIDNMTAGLTRQQAEPAAPTVVEPVAWGIVAANTGKVCQVELDREYVLGHNPAHIVPLYASTPREPLTDEDIDLITCKSWGGSLPGAMIDAFREYARAVITASGEPK